MRDEDESALRALTFEGRGDIGRGEDRVAGFVGEDELGRIVRIRGAAFDVAEAFRDGSCSFELFSDGECGFVGEDRVRLKGGT